jgi:hypothetical protein
MAQTQVTLAEQLQQLETLLGCPIDCPAQNQDKAVFLHYNDQCKEIDLPVDKIEFYTLLKDCAPEGRIKEALYVDEIGNQRHIVKINCSPNRPFPQEDLNQFLRNIRDRAGDFEGMGFTVNGEAVPEPQTLPQAAEGIDGKPITPEHSFSQKPGSNFLKTCLSTIAALLVHLPTNRDPKPLETTPLIQDFSKGKSH